MESKQFMGCCVSYTLKKKKNPKAVGPGLVWQPYIVPWDPGTFSLLMSLCPHEKLSSLRSSHDPRWLLVFQPHYLQSRQEKRRVRMVEGEEIHFSLKFLIWKRYTTLLICFPFLRKNTDI